jgi:hypothetical protein
MAGWAIQIIRDTFLTPTALQYCLAFFFQKINLKTYLIKALIGQVKWAILPNTFLSQKII